MVLGKELTALHPIWRQQAERNTGSAMDFSQSPPAVTYLLHQGHRSWKKATAPTRFQTVQQLGAKQANVWSHGGSILIQSNSVPPKLLLLLALMSDHASLSSCQITEIQKKRGGGGLDRQLELKMHLNQTCPD